MDKIILNGKRMITKDVTHAYLKRKLDLAPYYGRNLDALFDLLTERSQRTEIILINEMVMKKKLGPYGKALLQVFHDAEEENKHLYFFIA